jgi:hypothetical protein
MSDDRLSPRRLADIESAAQEALRGNLLEQAWGRKALELVREIRALKRDLDQAAKSAIDDAQETQRLRAAEGGLSAGGRPAGDRGAASAASARGSAVTGAQDCQPPICSR